jgi:hypothetical protein
MRLKQVEEKNPKLMHLSASPSEGESPRSSWQNVELRQISAAQLSKPCIPKHR